MKKALITGITGQDGSYLAELLLEKGYEVHGLIRRSSSFNTGRIEHLYQDPHLNNVRLFLHYGDLSDASNISRLLKKIKPDEIYHLGAQSHVKVSFDMPEYTADVTGLGTLRLLEAIRDSEIKTKFYQASSSEMFGKVLKRRKREYAVLSPLSLWLRESFGLLDNQKLSRKLQSFACNGILFNHESPRRGGTFVTKKITRRSRKIKFGFKKNYILAIWTRSAIGAMPKIMLKRCG